MLQIVRRAGLAAAVLLAASLSIVPASAGTCSGPYAGNTAGTDTNAIRQALNDICANSAAGASTAQPSENHIGSVGGAEFNVQDTPTVQAAAYALGNCIGGFRTLTVSRVANGGVVINNFGVRSISGITPTIQVVLFTANPTSSTCTDKGTFAINAADVDKIPAGGTFQVTLSQPAGSTPSFGNWPLLALSLNANASSQIYYALVATAAMTPGSTTDIHTASNGLQD